MSAPERLFGTDGMRAPFGAYPLDKPTVTTLGRVLGRSLSGAGPTDGASAPPTVVLGGDTRASTPTLCSWIARGLDAEGVSTRYAGVIPTAGVAALVRDLGADAGVVVSASHNPYPDNGIKLLDAAGFKWSARNESGFEDRLLLALDGAPEDPPLGALAGSPDPLGPPEETLVARYVDRLAASLEGERPLDGLRIVLDTGNGAASPIAGTLFERLGARTRLLHADPDGTNVNRACGSTDTGDLARAVRDGDFHLGAAFDGDADRVVLIDRDGRERDGDAILYLWASALDTVGDLEPRSIVATSMSNLGLERALGRRGIRTVRCAVGDRQVVATMRREGIALGGEQSGHIVHLGLTTTGDGLLTALQMAGLAARELREHGGDRPLTELLSDFQRFPQVLLNVRVRSKPELASIPEVARQIHEVEERLGGDGRLVLRYSGTEPLARVMIEGPEQEEIERLATGIASAIEKAIGADPRQPHGGANGQEAPA